MQKNNDVDRSCKLILSDLTLNVYLGCREHEKRKKQLVSVAIEINLQNIPKGADTDRLEDTICYSMLTKHIQNFVKDRKFHLIEKLSKDICDCIYMFLMAKQYSALVIKVTVHKNMSSVSAIKGGVFFTYSRNTPT